MKYYKFMHFRFYSNQWCLNYKPKWEKAILYEFYHVKRTQNSKFLKTYILLAIYIVSSEAF